MLHINKMRLLKKTWLPLSELWDIPIPEILMFLNSKDHTIYRINSLIKCVNQNYLQKKHIPQRTPNGISHITRSTQPVRNGKFDASHCNRSSFNTASQAAGTQNGLN